MEIKHYLEKIIEQMLEIQNSQDPGPKFLFILSKFSSKFNPYDNSDFRTLVPVIMSHPCELDSLFMTKVYRRDFSFLLEKKSRR